jgi:hypothetical protein
MIVIVVMKRFLYLTKILSGRIRPPHPMTNFELGKVGLKLPPVFGGGV